MVDGRFAGQVVMITGAAGGFGTAAAHRFAKEGARLVISDMCKSRLSVLSKQLSALGAKHVADVIDITAEAEIVSHIEHALETFGTLDVAINNAGIGQALRPLQDTDEADFDKIINVNAKGVFLGMKQQLKTMTQQRKGTILNIASAAGLVGAGHMAAYAASKHAVVGLTKAAADEVAKLGIRINALCPSFAPTPLFNEMADTIANRHGIDRDAAYDKVTSRVPMRRVAQVDEVVQAMLWACDPENSFMTGQAIAIDGGLTAV